MNFVLKIMFYLCVIGVIATMFISLSFDTSNIINFEYIMRTIENAPNVVSSLKIPNITIGSDWGILNFLRNFINALTGIVGFAQFIVFNLIQIVIYLAYFVEALFMF